MTTATRTATIVEFSATAPDGPLRAALSSETPVRRFFGEEILSHADEAIDFSDLTERGLPLTANHSEIGERALPIGRVTGLAVEDGRLRGDLEFDMPDPVAAGIRGKVERGIATDLSITYDYNADDVTREGDVHTVNRWRPLAVSVVTIPADPSVGIGRSKELDTMTATTPADDQAAAVAARREANAIHARAGELAARYPDLAPKLSELAATIADDVSGTAERFASRALDLIGEHGSAGSLAGEPSPTPVSPRGALVLAGDDELERRGPAMSAALLNLGRPSAVRAEELQGNPYVGWRVLDIAEDCLRLAGINTRGLSPREIAMAAITQPLVRHRQLGARAISPGTAQYTTANFPAVTESIGFKSLFDGFSVAPRTWDQWCNVGGAPDFNEFSVPRLSAISLLTQKGENQAYDNVTRTDAKESGQVAKRGGLHSLTWEAITNNDVNGFADTMAALGESAQATIDHYVYTHLISNPDMGDAAALFSAGHGPGADGNDTGQDLTREGIITTRVMMERQTDDNSRAIVPELSFVLVPPESWEKAIELSGPTAPGATEVNTLQNTFIPIKSHLLPAEGASETKHVWYALSRRGQTMRVFFLDGVQAPRLDREMAWDTDAMHYKAVIVFDAVPQDWRGFARNIPSGTIPS